MERLNHVIEALRQSHHMPALLSLLVGLVLFKKENSLLCEDEIIGDNIPTSLMDGLNS